MYLETDQNNPRFLYPTNAHWNPNTVNINITVLVTHDWCTDSPSDGYNFVFYCRSLNMSSNQWPGTPIEPATPVAEVHKSLLRKSFSAELACRTFAVPILVAALPSDGISVITFPKDQNDKEFSTYTNKYQSWVSTSFTSVFLRYTFCMTRFQNWIQILVKAKLEVFRSTQGAGNNI